MTSSTHEHTLNVALGEVLGRLRRSWKTRSEQTGQVLVEGGRPDILIEEASGWPVVIEAERSNPSSAEDDARPGLVARWPTQADRSRPRLRWCTRRTFFHFTALRCGMP